MAGGRQSSHKTPPGLVYRSRKSRDPKRPDCGVWEVSLSVPKDLQPLIPSRSGKPTRRLALSTGTSNYKQALSLYPELRRQLTLKLQALSDSVLDPDAHAQRILAQEYHRQRHSQTTDASAAKAQSNLQQIASDLAGLQAQGVSDAAIIQYLTGSTSDLNDLLEILLRRFAAERGLALSPSDLQKFVQSAKQISLLARDQRQSEQQRGYLHQESAESQRLIAESQKPTPQSLNTFLKLKASELSERTVLNYRTTLQHWRTIIGQIHTNSVTTATINRFIRTLHRPKEQEGYGYSTAAANASANRIISLLKTHNQHCGCDEQRLEIPNYDPIKTTTAERKAKKLRIRGNTMPDENVRALHQFFSREVDDGQLLWPLLRLAGLRISEALALEWNKIHNDLGGIWVVDLLESKTVDGIRLLPMNTALQRLILPYHPALNKDLRSSSPFVFPRFATLKSPKDAANGQRERFLERLMKQGIPLSGNTNFHAARHSFGTDLSYHTSDFFKRKLMGHSGGLTDQYSATILTNLQEIVECVGSTIAWT